MGESHSTVKATRSVSMASFCDVLLSVSMNGIRGERRRLRLVRGLGTDTKSLYMRSSLVIVYVDERFHTILTGALRYKILSLCRLANKI